MYFDNQTIWAVKQRRKYIMNDDYQEINQALVRVYNGILWVEEHELRKSMFRDLTI